MGTEAVQLDFKTVLVVDDDEVARNLIANYLGRLGVAEVDQREDGVSAWAALGEKHYDLIVLDWKLPGLSGLALFNRIRQRRVYRTVPLLVVSGLLEKQDFRLLQEFPCTSLMEKPFTMLLFQNRLEELQKESIWYGQNNALIDSVLEALGNDPKKAEALLKQVLKNAPNPLPLALLAAKRLVKSRMLKTARLVLESILRLDDQSVIALNELGKTLHLLGEHAKARDLLRQAHKISPQNLQRLCLLGEVELNLSDPEAAQKYFEKALAVDPDDKKANAGVVVSGNMQEMLEAPRPMQIPSTFASLLNTLGIVHVRSGEYAKGIEQYRAALAFLHAKDDAARVSFNLGLGFLRWGKPQDALPWFQRSERLAPSGFGKSAAYVRKLLIAGGDDKGLDEAVFVSRDQTAAKRAPLFHSDNESGKIIPFPTPEETAKGPASPDDIPEETMGNQIVLAGKDHLPPSIDFDGVIDELTGDEDLADVGTML